MALLDDIRNELAELIDAADEIKVQAENFMRQANDAEGGAVDGRVRASAVVQRMDELLLKLHSTDLAKASVADVSALIESTELALDQADEALDELDV